MRFLLTFVFISALLLVVYRRIIEPFLEGYRGNRKPYNTVPKKKKRKIDVSGAQDAEFKELD